MISIYFFKCKQSTKEVQNEVQMTTTPTSAFDNESQRYMSNRGMLVSRVGIPID